MAFKYEPCWHDNGPMKTKQEWLEDTKQLALARGGRCLSNEYINSDSKLDFECSKGHKFQSCRAYLQAGNWCPFCSGRGKTIADMQRLAELKGGSFLSDDFTTMSRKYLWSCSNGHQWEAKAQNIKSGKWCPECGRLNSAINRRKYTIDDMQGIAAERGGRCLSTEMQTVTEKIEWQCAKHHSWMATPHNIMSGNWCPECAKKTAASRRITHSIAKADKFAKAKGGRCLSKIFKQVKSKLEWECAEGHRWHANCDNVINGGKWCPFCAGTVKKTLKEMQQLAVSRGGTCLSKSYEDGKSKLLWRCNEGHEWVAVPQAIMRGSWCPECASGLGERICREFFEALFERPFPKSRPQWLRSEAGHLLELDGYCEELEIAFEHHGEQHFREIRHFHSGKKALNAQKSRDLYKRTVCKVNGVRLIEVPSIPDLLPLNQVSDFLKQAFTQYRILPKKWVDDSSIDLKKIYCPDKLEKIRSVAHQRGGELISNHYLGIFEKLEFRCAEGHIFFAAPNNVVNSGSWCPYCIGRNKTIEDMQELARTRGGRCLSRAYINSKIALTWECDKGHTWDAQPSNVFFGTWCPECAKTIRGLKRRKYSLEMMQSLAMQAGGKCLSPEYHGYKSPLEWQCANGHQFRKTPEAVIIRKNFCPHCKRMIRKSV